MFTYLYLSLLKKMYFVSEFLTDWVKRKVIQVYLYRYILIFQQFDSALKRQ